MGDTTLTNTICEIGIPALLNSKADPQNKINNQFKRGMKVVDLIPVDFKLGVPKFNLADPSKNNYMIQYIYDKPMDLYKKICNSYGLKEGYSALRLYVTGDSVHQETFSNSFSENWIQSQVNGLSKFGENINSITRAFGDTGAAFRKDAAAGVTDLVNKGLGAISTSNNTVNAQLSNFKDSTIINALTNIIINGNKFSLPKTWHDSNYSPSLSLNLQLISPYGHPNAIFNFVLAPLIRLLIMASPNSNDGLTYGNPKYVRVKGYGITNINIGIIDSISLQRGGADTVYNAFKQPLNLNLNISIKPALDGFASIFNEDDSSIKDLMTFDKLLSDPKDSFALETDSGPGFTSIGNIIKSFKVPPQDVLDFSETKIPSTGGGSAVASAQTASSGIISATSNAITNITGGISSLNATPINLSGL